ncbi:Uncharacterized protein GBIM_05483, partial [Gryllus bimaculatus]
AIADTPRPFIHCPRDLKIELPRHQNSVHVRIPQPKSNMDWWRYVDSDPPWGKQLEADLKVGTTTVTFTAHNPLDNSSASCSVLIFVRDTEAPRMTDCPQSFDVQLAPGEKSKVITWDEPIFIDNVGVVQVYKSKEPGKSMSAGLHHVNYLASDAAGNRAKCQFSIHVKEQEPRKLPYPPNTSFRKMVICPGRAVTRIVTPVYPWQIPKGCHLGQGRVTSTTQVMAGTFTMRQGSRQNPSVIPQNRGHRIRHRGPGEKRRMRKQRLQSNTSPDTLIQVPEQNVANTRRHCCET